MARRRVRSNGMLFMLALHAASQFLQLDRKPPITAMLILANVMMFLRPGSLDEVLPSTHEVCLSPRFVLKDFDLKRLYLSAFCHVDETHLVYNMLSLLWKGVQLENTMGSGKFASMVALLLGMSHGISVVLAKLASILFDSPAPLDSCAVGFSAVLFAMKIVLNHNSPANTVVYGVVVPARYAAWAELILVQMFVPGTSFLGHLAGILAGLIYVNGPRFRGSSIISRFARWSWMLVTRPFRFLLGDSSRPRHYGGGVIGSSSSSSSRDRPGDGDGTRRRQTAVWRCSVCTYDNSVTLNACDMCGTPRPGGGGGGQGDNSPSAPPWPEERGPNLSMEEIRRARLARFSSARHS